MGSEMDLDGQAYPDWYPDYEEEYAGNIDNNFYEGEEYDMDDMYYDQYQDGYDDDTYQRISFNELLDECIIPTGSQAANTIMPLLGLCVVLRLTCFFGSSGSGGQPGLVPATLLHILSAATGLFALYNFFEENLIYCATLALLSYVLLLVMVSKCRGMSGLAVSVVTVVYLLTCELMVVDKKEWHQIRGAQMVLSMKVISVAFDLDHGSLQELPGLFEFCGYVFHVGSVIFGPWVSYHEYSAILHQKERKLDFYWVMKVVKTSVLALAMVVMSTCLVHWLILDGSWIWLVAYRDAQSFRFSHYFISFISELTMTLSGLGATKNNGDVRWDLSVSRPLHIEFPRSLVEVVTNWHMPMHYWLKTYVFKTARPLGTFAAILLTYAASSILHGLNFQLTAVLLSLGIYSYIEYVLRNRISQLFNACVQARRCKPDCQHTYKSMHPYVIVTNLILGGVAVFHLAYLGLMFDSSPEEEQGYTMSHTLSKWSELSYASHWVVLATYIFYLLS